MGNQTLSSSISVYTPPIPNYPIEIHYGKYDEDTLRFAVFDKASGQEICSQSLKVPSPGDVDPDTYINPAVLPIVTASTAMTAMPAIHAAEGETMRVFLPFEDCPIALGYWQPLDGAMGLQLMFWPSQQVIFYRKCGIEDDVLSVSQNVMFCLYSQIDLELVYQDGKLAAMEGHLTVQFHPPMSVALHSFSIPVRIPVSA